MRANEIFPGSVMPSTHDGEWTFTYWVTNKWITDEDQQGSVTYVSASRAKEAMREKVELLRSQAEA